MSIVDTLGEQLMHYDLNQVLTMLVEARDMLLVAILNIIIVDTLLWLAGFRSTLLRGLVALSILLATLMKMHWALFLFNALGLPLMLAVAVGGIFLKIVFAPKTVAKKMLKKRRKR